MVCLTDILLTGYYLDRNLCLVLSTNLGHPAQASMTWTRLAHQLQIVKPKPIRQQMEVPPT
jgi:hypothetical protein